jgi:hypothetical protein
MSLQGPLIVVAEQPAAELVEALSAAGAFPIVETTWAGAPAAFLTVKPSAVVIAEPRSPANDASGAHVLPADRNRRAAQSGPRHLLHRARAQPRCLLSGCSCASNQQCGCARSTPLCCAALSCSLLTVADCQCCRLATHSTMQLY